MKNDFIPYYSEDVLMGLNISIQEVIASIEALLKAKENHAAWSAPKTVVQPGIDSTETHDNSSADNPVKPEKNDERYMMATLAAQDNPDILAVKTLVLNPENTKKGLPTMNGLVTMLDSQTGLPLAILDSNWVTEVRTAGLSATAAKRMANESSSVLALVGCGVQAKSHIRAFAELFPLKEVRLFGRGQANIDARKQEAEALGFAVTVCDSGKEAITNADLVVTSVTFSPNLKPFLDAAWVKPGAFCAITDLSAPWHKESFSAFDQICIDDLVQESALPNKLVAEQLINGDLAGLVAGRFSGRSASNHRNAFIYRGHALGDLALASLAYQKATNRT